MPLFLYKCSYLVVLVLVVSILVSGCTKSDSEQAYATATMPTPVLTPSGAARLREHEPTPTAPVVATPTVVSPQETAEEKTMNDLLAFYTYDRAAPLDPSTQMVTETVSYKRYEVSFPSLVKTAYPNNDIVYGSYFQPKSPGKHPSIIIVHGWGAVSRDEYALFAQMLVEQGFAAFIITLPLHMERTPPGKISGEYIFLGSVDQAALGFKQAVIDIRRAADWLSIRPEINPAMLGIAGYSLGAIVTNLVMGIDTRFTVGVAMVGGGDLARIIWESSITRDIRADIQKQGLSLADLQQHWAVIDPLSFAGRNRQRKVLFLNGRYDDIVPPAATKELWSALGEPEIVWYDSGHMLPLPIALPRAVAFFDRYFKTVKP